MASMLMKEFYYQAAHMKVSLSIGWDGDVCAYHSVEVRSGLNLPTGDSGFNRIDSAREFGPSHDQYVAAADLFKRIVSPML